LLVCGTPDREAFPGTDAWYDVRPGAADAAGHRTAGHWIPAEGEVLLSLLTSLRAAGVPAAEVRVVSPFRAVAAAAARVYGAVFGEVSAEELRTRVGTVHTVRPGDVVILVLGSDPSGPDARSFVSQAPNLLNSAVGRARRRLYVIGDRDAWASQPYFEALARRLADAELAPLNDGYATRRNLAG
jgi:superfamily I DNA and/or RNA helicase